jgi:hypothetical protein
MVFAKHVPLVLYTTLEYVTTLFFISDYETFYIDLAIYLGMYYT